jgi:hypothetical protein
LQHRAELTADLFGDGVDDSWGKTDVTGTRSRRYVDSPYMSQTKAVISTRNSLIATLKEGQEGF